MSILWRFGSYLKERQRWVLISLLAVLHLTLLAGTESAVGLMCWPVDVGFFILWQPFIHLSAALAGTLLLLAAVLATGAPLFSPWFLILWWRCWRACSAAG